MPQNRATPTMMANTSKNLTCLDPFMLGEGYHNNHHALGIEPTLQRNGNEIDPIYPITCLFDWIGIIKLNSAMLVISSYTLINV